MQVQHVGFAWFREEDYETLRDMFAGEDGLPELYADWLERADEGERRLKAKGYTTHRAIIDPKTFPVWCKENGLNVDARARVRFASAVAARSAQHGGGVIH